MDKQLLGYVKFGYWTGIIADFIFGFMLMFAPRITEFFWGLDLQMTSMERFWAAYAGVMIVAWSFMLLLGLKAPVKRAGMLLITVLCILFPFMTLQGIAIFTDMLTLGSLKIMFICQIVFTLILSNGYLASRKMSQ